jgi:hypothetical protein
VSVQASFPASRMLPKQVLSIVATFPYLPKKINKKT